MTYRVQRVRSKWAPGLVDSGQGHGNGPQRLYPTEDAALQRVCEDLARLGVEEPIASRDGGSIVITADDAVYIVSQAG